MLNFGNDVPRGGIQVSEESLQEWVSTIVDLVSQGEIALVARDGRPVVAMISMGDFLTHPAFKKTVRKLNGGH